jgi:hypothetical protein
MRNTTPPLIALCDIGRYARIDNQNLLVSLDTFPGALRHLWAAAFVPGRALIDVTAQATQGNNKP